MNKFEKRIFTKSIWVMEPKKVKQIINELEIRDLKIKEFVELKLLNKCLILKDNKRWIRLLRFLIESLIFKN